MVREVAPKPAKKDLKKPGDLDFAKANRALKKIIRENKTWLKDMAKR